jgi:hypothetical protein
MLQHEEMMLVETGRKERLIMKKNYMVKREALKKHH